MRKFEELKSLILASEKDACKFYGKGNRTAGTRLRGFLQRSKTLAQEIRLEIIARKKAVR